MENEKDTEKKLKLTVTLTPGELAELEVALTGLEIMRHDEDDKVSMKMKVEAAIGRTWTKYGFT